MEIYLDNAATTRVSPEAAEAALRMMCEEYGNPGSTHAKGRAARVVLDEARRQVAAPLRCRGLGESLGEMLPGLSLRLRVRAELLHSNDIS